MSKKEEAQAVAGDQNDETAAAETAAQTQARPASEAPTPDSLSPGQLAELLAKALKAEENWDKYVRVTAEFDNFRKRTAREKQDAIRYANEGLLERLVPVIDNFDAALAAAASPESATVESLKTGVAMIHAQLKGVMKDAGLEEIDATGQTFDPTIHEAVAQHETADVPEGQVFQQLRKGYKLKDRLVRPATVVVARKPAA